MAAKKTQSQAARLKNAARLRGKVAVVTGGSRGIGYAIARTLAGEGCSVVITGRNPATLRKSAAQISKSVGAQKSPLRIVDRVCDVRDPKSVAALFAGVKERFGKVDVLVNNAGLAQPLIPIQQTSDELWRNVLDTNLTGLFYCARAALPLMNAGGTIINNLSVAAKTIFPNFAAYNTSKHGALGFTLSLREELKTRGIRVVALMPGAIDTEIWNQFWPEAPRGRMVDADSVAEAVLYAVLLPHKANLTELRIDPTGGAL